MGSLYRFTKTGQEPNDDETHAPQKFKLEGIGEPSLGHAQQELPNGSRGWHRHGRPKAARQATLDRAFRLNPERFVRKPPEPPARPTAVWINPPLKGHNNQV